MSSNMQEQLEQLRTSGLEAIAAAPAERELEEARVKYLGRKGLLTEVLRGLGQAAPEERPAIGQAANEIKAALQTAIDARRAEFEKQAEAQRAQDQRIDLSLPGRRPPKGHKHPISLVTEEICGIFAELGFQIATGPDVETEYYNFDSLNTPPDHPARDSHDTFFVKPGVVLRTHTSPVQMRVMEKTQPPVAVVAPGRVYRVDADSTHSPMFYQLEGLLVDQGVSFADLKGAIELFIERFFGPGIEVRFNPHFFPFTEPSAEVHVKWSAGDGGEVGRWLELMGCAWSTPKCSAMPDTTPKCIRATRSAWASTGSSWRSTVSTASATFTTTTCGFWSSSDSCAFLSIG
jgi:phenylalanyl-tRNA synthetase alpha chain